MLSKIKQLNKICDRIIANIKPADSLKNEDKNQDICERTIKAAQTRTICEEFAEEHMRDIIVPKRNSSNGLHFLTKMFHPKLKSIFLPKPFKDVLKCHDTFHKARPELHRACQEKN